LEIGRLERFAQLLVRMAYDAHTPSSQIRTALKLSMEVF